MWEKTGCISSCCSSAPSLCSRASADVSHLTSPHQAPCGAACPACALPAGHEHGSAAEHSLHRRGLIPSGHKLSLGAIQAQMLWDSQSRWALSSARLAGGEQEVLEEQGQREELPAIIYQLACCLASAHVSPHSEKVVHICPKACTFIFFPNSSVRFSNYIFTYPH